jgi:hypothetical protein
MKNTQRSSKFSLKELSTAVLFLAVLSFIGCGGSSATAPPPADDGGPRFNSPPPQSNVQVKIGDSPSERIIALKVTLKSIQATPSSGTSVSVLSSPVPMEVTHLAASNQLLSEITMPQGNYTKIVVTMSGATVTYLDVNTNQPVQKTFSSVPTATINFSPALTIKEGGNVLNFDVDVAKTVNLDLAHGTVKLNTPVFKISAQSIASGQQLPETGAVEHITGKVTAVSGTAFTIKCGQSGQALTFGTGIDTVFINTSIDSMTNLIVSVEAESLADGTLLATRVENVSASSGVSVEGLITGYTGFGYLSVAMQDGTGSGMTDAMIGSNLALGMDGNTSFTFNSNDVDMTDLPFTFDENSIVPGQRVAVSSSSAMQNDPEGVNAGYVTAATIELQKQTLSGTVSNFVDNGDGTTTFDLALSADGNSYLSATSPGVTSVEVHTSSKTGMNNVSGSLQGKSVKVRGFLFYADPSAFSLAHNQSRPFVGGGGGGGSSPYFAVVASLISQ